MSTEIAELQFAQGDLARAITVYVENALPLNLHGMRECERILREDGEGNTTYWSHPSYLLATVAMAEGVLSRIRSVGFV